MATLLTELQRRNVFKVALAYLVLGWLVLQITDILAPALHLPDWTVTFVTFLGLIGLPFALLFAWAFEMTPEGLKRTQEVAPDQSITHVTGEKLGRLTFTLVVLAVALLVLDRFLLDGRQPAAETAAEAAPSGESPASASPAGSTRSIAVLPFVNMSNDPEQEYFSDGISEELLNGLAKITDLRVAARTSSFAFKGLNQNITEIGEQLRVDTVLEGSVRKAGQRVRITAQLIDVSDGYHLWSETYDRDLVDIFAIQDEISRAIVAALQVHLTGEESTTTTREVNLEAYNFYLLGKHSLRRRTEKSLLLAQKQFQSAIDAEPSYAEAWAGKATATALLSESDYGRLTEQQAISRAQALLDRAFELEPDLPAAHATQALLHMDGDNYHAAIESLEKAIALNPSEGILYSWRHNALAALGNYRAAMASLEEAFRIDPLHQTIRHNLAAQWAAFGQAARAREMVSPDTALAWEIESIIAQSERRYADGFQAIERAISRAESGYDLRLELSRSLMLFFNLANAELAREGVPDRVRDFYTAVLDPEALVPPGTLPAIEFGGHTDMVKLSAWTVALVKQDRCDDVISLLAHRNFETGPLSGNLGGLGDPNLAIHYSYCLNRTGRPDRSRAVAQQLKAYLDTAIANGEPGGYYDFLARVQLLLGEEQQALGSLRLGMQQNFGLNWSALAYPEFDAVRHDPGFQEVLGALEQQINRDRAKLGWPEIQLHRG